MNDEQAKKNKRLKILTIIAVIIVIILIIQFAFQKPIIQEGPYTLIFGFTQELYAEGDGNPDTPEWNYVVFPFSILYCQSSNSIENIFGSILNESGITAIFAEIEGEWVSWGSLLDPIFITLHEIHPYQIYYVSVENDCTLYLQC